MSAGHITNPAYIFHIRIINDNNLSQAVPILVQYNVPYILESNPH